VGDDLIDLERIVVRLKNASTDTSALEISLTDLQRRYRALCDNSLGKLSDLLTAVSTAAECEHEHESIFRWLTAAENQLLAFDGDGESVSAEDKRQRQEVLLSL